MPSESKLAPPTLWAQNGISIFLTFDMEFKKTWVTVEKEYIIFKGIGLADLKEYEVRIDLFSDIIVDDYKELNTGRCFELTLFKADVFDPFWPRLTRDKAKLHWLKVDFKRLQDDEEEDVTPVDMTEESESDSLDTPDPQLE